MTAAHRMNAAFAVGLAAAAWLIRTTVDGGPMNLNRALAIGAFVFVLWFLLSHLIDRRSVALAVVVGALWFVSATASALWFGLMLGVLE